MALRQHRTSLTVLSLTGLLVAGLGTAAQAGSQAAAPHFEAPTLSAAQLAGTPDPGRGWIFGSVVDTNGDPVENARVEVYDYWGDVEGPMSSGLTYGGEFELYRLPAGPDALYQVKVSTGPGSPHPIRTTWVGDEDGIELKRRQVLELPPITVKYQKVASRTSAAVAPARMGHGSKARVTVRVAPGAGSDLRPTGKVTYQVLSGSKKVDAGTGTLRNGTVTLSTRRLAGPPAVTCTKAQKKKRKCPKQAKQRAYSVNVSYAGSPQFKASKAAPVKLVVTFKK
ncbi:hypothetical protein [Nocardioides sp. zg-DK7169]|uniref:hypothetical protein n=1 Tax=Nocardioides sp. zg-DK7169 TaxID=2736600 RepID=UPI0015564ED7|nr:hypothetical protein [Nocardioides sp. zg-DK7169]NPC99101.1 hypothetical protein [Nocardioides sp. zg-DK7169]